MRKHLRTRQHLEAHKLLSCAYRDSTEAALIIQKHVRQHVVFTAFMHAICGYVLGVRDTFEISNVSCS